MSKSVGEQIYDHILSQNWDVDEVIAGLANNFVNIGLGSGLTDEDLIGLLILTINTLNEIGEHDGQTH